MYVEGTGRTPEEARQNAIANAQMMRMQAGALQFALAIVWIMIKGWVAFIWTLLLCTLRPVAGSVFLAGLGAACLVRPLMSALVSRQDHPNIHLFLDMGLVIGGLAVMAIIGRKALQFLSLLEHREAEILRNLLTKRPTAGRITFAFLYGYTMLAALAGAAALLWLVGQVAAPSALWHTLTTEWRTAPPLLFVAATALSLAIAVSAVLIRYHRHPLCRTLTITGLRRS